MQTDKTECHLSHAGLRQLSKQLLEQARRNEPTVKPRPGLVLHIMQTQRRLSVREATCITRRPAVKPSGIKHRLSVIRGWFRKMVACG